MYLLDSNTLIEAKNRYYSFEVCPGFWKWLEDFGRSNSAISVKKVREEIEQGNDELAEWIKTIPKEYFIDADIDIQTSFRAIANYLMDERTIISESERNRFLSGADPWLIATAINANATIITQETLVPLNSKKVKIPNICIYFGVKYMNIFELLRLEKVSFGLQ